MGLATPSLSVGKDANVVAVDGALNQLADLLEHLRLRRLRVEHPVELEVVLAVLALETARNPCVAGTVGTSGQSEVFLVDKVDVFDLAIILSDFLTEEGPDPAEDADVALQLLDRVV